MKYASVQGIAMGMALGLLGGWALSSDASARDLFSTLFGAFTGGGAPAMTPPSIPSPFGGNTDDTRPPSTSRTGGGRTAYCVRTCDGRYFPVPTSDGESRTSACSSLCPAAETKVFYGGSIDNASTENGKSYSDLPNAFRYRNEMVSGCSCNGKDPTGLAAIKIEDDWTLRKGDIVAGPDGLMRATGRADRRASANFSPVSPSVRAKFSRLPVVASE